MRDVLSELTKIKDEAISFTAKSDEELDNWLATTKNNLSNLYNGKEEALKRINNIENHGAVLSLYAPTGLESTIDSRSTTVTSEVIENINFFLEELSS